MKKVVFIALMAMSSVSIFSQIKTSEVKIQETKQIAVYDSTANYLEKNIDLYVGQQLYVPKVTGYEKSNGFDRFKKDVKGNVYESFGYPARTKYDAVAGKYFDVVEIERNTRAYKGDVYLKLKEKETGKIIYYDYKSDIRFPFVVVGYFEAQKKKLIGSIFPILDISLSNTIDLTTGNKMKIDYMKKRTTDNYYDEWICIDYTIEEDSEWNEVVVLKNDDSRQMKLTLKKAEEYVKIALNANIDVKNHDKAVEKYGNLRVGISEEGVRALLGAPEKINTTKTEYRTSEQWVYKDKYIYIEDGKVTAIQQ